MSKQNMDDNDLIEFVDTEEDAVVEKKIENRGGKSKVKGIAIAAAVVVAAGAICFALGAGGKASQETEPQTQSEKVYKVSVIEVIPTGNDVYLTYTGIVQPKAMDQLSFSSIGTVEQVLVTEGQEVKAGDLLAVIDDSSAQRQLENSKNSLQIAETNYRSAAQQRQTAYDNYMKACSPDDAKETLDSTIKRRDDQQVKVNELSAAVIALEEAQRAAKSEYDTAGSQLTQAQNDLSIKRTELAFMKEAGTATEAEIIQKQAEVDALSAQADLFSQAYNEKQTAYVRAEADYRSKQTELDAAKATLTTYNETVDAAQDAYEDKLENGADTADAKALKEVFDTADVAFYNSEATYNSAKNNYETALEAIEDCKLYAANDGTVLTVTVSEGQTATPIAPAVVIGSSQSVVSFGVSQSDVREMQAGLTATVMVNGETFDGVVKSVSLLPDEVSRTYMTEVAIEAENTEFYLGEMSTVKIAVGEREGVWLPLAVILNDGQDYVYLAENGRAKRQNIVIKEVSNDMVMVTGLESGGQVISEGMKIVRTGSLVSVE